MFFKPMEQLVQTMNAIKCGDLDAKMETDYRVVEFKQLSDTFNGMMEEIKSLKIAVYEKELELQKAQLQYLQIQIRPHFFLNCLKNLYALAQERRFEQIQQMILALSDYLRYLFSDNMTLVPLRDELQSVRRYLLLQQMSASCPPPATSTRMNNFLIFKCLRCPF
ncbi:sensor histidine kinase [Anaeromassilibacillus sp. SJQ-1]|uniref:sensor histidine kinase n=1 Tax=Anaeromassilibacillus sp. SJQ-1 TaxID=3375419 RepID=UPI003988F4C5